MPRRRNPHPTAPPSSARPPAFWSAIRPRRGPAIRTAARGSPWTASEMSSSCSTPPTRTSPFTRWAGPDRPTAEPPSPTRAASRPHQRSGHGQLRIPVRRPRRHHRQRLCGIPGLGAERPERDRVLRLGERRRPVQPCAQRRRSQPGAYRLHRFPGDRGRQLRGLLAGNRVRRLCRLCRRWRQLREASALDVHRPRVRGHRGGQPGPRHRRRGVLALGSRRRPTTLCRSPTTARSAGSPPFPSSLPPIKASTSALRWSCLRFTCPSTPALSRATLGSSAKERTVARPPWTSIRIRSLRPIRCPARSTWPTWTPRKATRRTSISLNRRIGAPPGRPP